MREKTRRVMQSSITNTRTLLAYHRSFLAVLTQQGQLPLSLLQLPPLTTPDLLCMEQQGLSWTTTSRVPRLLDEKPLETLGISLPPTPPEH